MNNLNNFPAYTEWLEEKNLAPTTIRSYLDILRKVKAEILTTQALKAYFQANLTNYDPSSLKVQKYALNSYVKFKKLQIEWEKISRIIPSAQRKFFDTINEAELALLKQARVEKNESIWKRNNLILDFLFYSGVRINELVNIRHRDWQNNSLRIHGKGNKVRYIFLPPFLISHFQPYSQNYLFLNQRGNPIKAEYLRWLLKARTAKAQIPKRITPHTFRRSFATHLRKNGSQLETIQTLLGHSSIQTTQVYIQYDRDYLYQDYSRLWKENPSHALH